MKPRDTVRAWAGVVRSSAVVRSAGALVGGTAAAQLVTVVALPFLTRLYSPADFTVLAVYTAALFIFTLPATGRFDLAIPIADRDDQAANLLVLTVLCSAFTALLLVALLVVDDGVIRLVGLERLHSYLWLLPVSIFASGSFMGLRNWWLRRKAFGMLGTTPISQALAGISVQIGAGILGWKPIGLLVGHLMISGAGSVKLTRELIRRDRSVFSEVNWRSLRKNAYDFRSYPKYSVLDALAAGAGNQLPLIIIAAIAAGPEAGLLLLTTRVLGAPVQLLSGAIAQVYLSSVRHVHAEGRLHDATEKLVRALMLFGAAPLLFCSLAAAPLFGIIFGERWSAAGVMLMWVAPWFALRLVVAPLMSLPAAVGKQRLMMLARIATLVVRIAAVYGGYYLWNGRAVEALAIASVGHWILLMALFFQMAGVRFRRLGVGFFGFPVVAGALGLLVARLISPLLA